MRPERLGLTILLLGLLTSGCYYSSNHTGWERTTPRTTVGGNVHTVFCELYPDMFGLDHEAVDQLSLTGVSWAEMGLTFHVAYLTDIYAVQDIRHWRDRERLDWQACFLRAGVSPSSIFLPLDEKEHLGPPYSRAYAYRASWNGGDWMYHISETEYERLFELWLIANTYGMSAANSANHAKKHLDFSGSTASLWSQMTPQRREDLRSVRTRREATGKRERQRRFSEGG